MQRVDRLVEARGEREVEISIVFVRRGASEVEVPDKEPWGRDRRRNSRQVSKELISEGVVRWPVHVGDGETIITGRGLEQRSYGER